VYYVAQKWMETKFWIFFSVGSDYSCEKVCIKATFCREIIHEIWASVIFASTCKANIRTNESGLVFQSAQYVDKYSSPLLLLFYTGKSYSGKHRTHHPIYSKHFICFPEDFRVISESSNTMLCISLSINLHEDEGQKHENWIPIGWMPCFDDEKARTLRPG
jgi:hypothetical protein